MPHIPYYLFSLRYYVLFVHLCLCLNRLCKPLSGSLDLTLSDYPAGNPEYVQTTPQGQSEGHLRLNKKRLFRVLMVQDCPMGLTKSE